MIYLSNDPYPQEISIPRSFGVIVPQRKVYLTEDDIATDLETDSDRKVLAASQGVRLKEMVDGKADADAVYTKSQVDDALAAKQDTLTPGENIRIENNVISAVVPEVDAYTRQETDDLLALKADKTDTYTKQQVDTALAGKQDTINDLQTIREGAAAGATAYQKPQTGIPASDLAEGVIPTIPVEDVKVGGASVVNNKIAEIPAIPDAVEANPTIPAWVTPTDLQNLKVGDDYFSVPQGGGEQEIFWAEYGVTTAAEIAQAVADGKLVACLADYTGSNGHLFVLSQTKNTLFWEFGCTEQSTGYYLRCSKTTNVWSQGRVFLESSSNKSQSVPTDRESTTNYPSVKAVADYAVQALTASGKKIWAGTQAEYELLTPDNDTIYFIIPVL